MSIWCYEPKILNGFTKVDLYKFHRNIAAKTVCLFCSSLLETIDELTDLPGVGRDYLETTDSAGWKEGRANDLFVTLPKKSLSHIVYKEFPVQNVIRACNTCGWYAGFKETLQRKGSWKVVQSYGGMGTIKALDASDISTPIAEVRAYLTGRYDARFNIHPRVFEETVASVFRDLGYKARVTSYSGDNGIDIILEGPSDTLIGVQVKRYGAKISISQIRELVGALYLQGMTRGMFITTSEFTSGGLDTTNLAEIRGQQIELIDAPKFFEALQIAQREHFKKSSTKDVEYLQRRLQLLLTQESSGGDHNDGRWLT